MNPIGRPARSAIPAAATLAAAAISVRLPPQHAPSDSVHQWASSPSFAALQLLDDGDHRGGERDVVDDPEAVCTSQMRRMRATVSSNGSARSSKMR